MFMPSISLRRCLFRISVIQHLVYKCFNIKYWIMPSNFIGMYLDSERIDIYIGNTYNKFLALNGAKLFVTVGKL